MDRTHRPASRRLGTAWHDKYWEADKQLATVIAAAPKLLAERDVLKQQRDELLASIDKAKYWMVGTEARRILDAAIAKGEK